jgi:hypothetical protein
MNNGIVSIFGDHLNSILYGLLFLFVAVAFVAHRSLYDNLKRYDPPQWMALGSPELFKITKRQFTGMNGIRDELRFHWYIWSMKYRRSENLKIKIAGDVVFGCSVGIWLIAVLLTFGH